VSPTSFYKKSLFFAQAPGFFLSIGEIRLEVSCRSPNCCLWWVLHWMSLPYLHAKDPSWFGPQLSFLKSMSLKDSVLLRELRPPRYVLYMSIQYIVASPLCVHNTKVLQIKSLYKYVRQNWLCPSLRVLYINILNTTLSSFYPLTLISSQHGMCPRWLFFMS
jgi:hypothetical protein